jgi:hypothetical protein
MHELVIREFLKDHPEHIPGVAYRQLGDRMELCLDTPTMKAFTDWTIRTGRGDRKKATEFRSWLNNGGFDRSFSDSLGKAKENPPHAD